MIYVRHYRGCTCYGEQSSSDGKLGVSYLSSSCGLEGANSGHQACGAKAFCLPTHMDICFTVISKVIKLEPKVFLLYSGVNSQCKLWTTQKRKNSVVGGLGFVLKQN